MRNALIKMRLIVFFMFTLVVCKKDCGSKVATCQEEPPNEPCLAYFETWFYNQTNNNCEKIGYSGCSKKGFETENDCKQCECNK